METGEFREEIGRDNQEMSEAHPPYKPHLLGGFERSKQGQMGENKTSFPLNSSDIKFMPMWQIFE